ncbi:MAG: RNA-directed DNA polymerase [Acidobacteria bacterium]|nr:RNA-directed DNA polymerase [Acidobacteriota bacterium]
MKISFPAAVVSAVARSLMAGEPTVEGAHVRMMRTLGRPYRWLLPLAGRYVRAFAGRTRPRLREVVQFLLNDRGFRRVRQRQLAVEHWLTEPQRMLPCGPAAEWGLPVVECEADLAGWLGLHLSELEWFSDRKGLCRKHGSEKLQHYHYRMEEKRSGGIRLVECPKRELKELQRWILGSLLDRIPAHAAAHGFVKGRSIVSFAAPHAGKAVLLRMDMENFFPSFPAARVAALFRTLGYPEVVAEHLMGLCTNAVPRGVWGTRVEGRMLYSRRHLPQGAPTSPALANAMAYRLDCRLTGLARTAGAVYTRYADDLAFSGGEEFRRVVDRFGIHVAAVALEEGFAVNHRKTRVMGQGMRQALAGVVVNQGVSIRRDELEKLEAILTNCVRTGLAAQNREGVADFRAHLEGRIGFVEMVHREKGRRLRAIFEKIRG